MLGEGKKSYSARILYVHVYTYQEFEPRQYMATRVETSSTPTCTKGYRVWHSEYKASYILSRNLIFADKRAEFSQLVMGNTLKHLYW